eukprot:1362962-Prymnesium_polylepis.1
MVSAAVCGKRSKLDRRQSAQARLEARARRGDAVGGEFPYVPTVLIFKHQAIYVTLHVRGDPATRPALSVGQRVCGGTKHVGFTSNTRAVKVGMAC